MNSSIIESIYAGETPHILVPDVKLKDGEEQDWNYREKEEKMIELWNGSEEG